MAFWQMKHWAQNLGAYLFMGSPTATQNPQAEEAIAWPFPAHAHESRAAWSAQEVGAAPVIEVLDGYLCATMVDSQPRRLAWLLKLHLAIELNYNWPLVLHMEQTHVNLQMTALTGVAQLPSIYLQPPRKNYIPNASTRLQSLSPSISGTDTELRINGTGEFFLHASGGTAYFTDDPETAAMVGVELPLSLQQPYSLAVPFSPAENVTAGVFLWSFSSD